MNVRVVSVLCPACGEWIRTGPPPVVPATLVQGSWLCPVHRTRVTWGLEPAGDEPLSSPADYGLDGDWTDAIGPDLHR